MKTFKTIRIAENLILTSKKSNDSWFLTKNDQIVKMKCAKFENNKYFIMGVPMINKMPLFVTPIDSTKLKIFKSDGELDDTLSTYEMNEVASKMICLSLKDNFVFIPILHTM